MHTLDRNTSPAFSFQNDRYANFGHDNAMSEWAAYNAYIEGSAALTERITPKEEMEKLVVDGAKFVETGVESAERHALSKEAFNYAFIEYVANSNRSHYEKAISGILTSFEVLSELRIADPESSLSRIVNNSALLEPLNRNDVVPDQTVAIPLAINKEDPATIVNALRILAKSQRESDRLTEVVLWANARYNSVEEEASCRETAQENYDLLKRTISEIDIDDSCLQIKAALQVDQAEKMTMSKIRRNQMDAVIAMCHVQQRGYNFPVTWMDADIKALNDRAIDNTSSSARNLEDKIIHGAIRYDSGEQEHIDTNLGDAGKVTVLRELFRRKVERQFQLSRSLKGADPMLVGYIEESGLCFAIGTYMMAGGVDTERPVDESYSYIQRKRHQDNIPGSLGRVIAARSVVQKYLLGTKLQYDKSYHPTQEEKYENTAISPQLNNKSKFTMSGRNALRNYLEFGHDGLVNPHNKNYRGLFSDRNVGDMPSPDQSETKESLEQLLNRLRDYDSDIASMWHSLDADSQKSIAEEMSAVIDKLTRTVS